MPVHTQRAAELHKQGHNCAQAVLCSYCGELGLPEETARLMMSGCGNGLGDTQGVCGAVLSGILVLGLRHGGDRSLVREKTVDFKEAFAARAGALNCHELRRDRASCGALVALATELLED